MHVARKSLGDLMSNSASDSLGVCGVAESPCRRVATSLFEGKARILGPHSIVLARPGQALGAVTIDSYVDQLTRVTATPERGKGKRRPFSEMSQAGDSGNPELWNSTYYAVQLDPTLRVPHLKP